MRITESMIANTILKNLQSGQSKLETLQQQISSGYKVSKPGDDPISAQQILQLSGMVQAADQYSRNINTGNAWLEQADSSMANMGDIVTRAREIAVSMSNGTYSALDRKNVASEVAQLKKELVQLGNTQVAGKYIFGGFVSDKQPFDEVTGAYSGTEDKINMEINRGAYVDINVSGGTLIRGGTPPGSTGSDLFGELDNLFNALNNNDPTAIKGTITGLISAQNQILAQRSDVGARLNRVQTASDSLEYMKTSLKKVISSKKDVDILQATSDLTNQKNAFEIALSASAKTSQLSLLNYLK